MPEGNEWLRDIPAILNDAGEEVVLRLDRDPPPHTVRLMETLGVRIEVVKQVAAHALLQVWDCVRPGCVREAEAGSMYCREHQEETVPVKTVEETTRCPHREFGCDWEYKGSKLRGEGFLQRHLEFSHPKCSALLCEEPALPGMDRCRRHAPIADLREQRLAGEDSERTPDMDNSAAKLLAGGPVEPSREDNGMDKHARKWSREEIIVTIQEHVLMHGHPPSAKDWSIGGDHPSKGTVTRMFGGWAEAIEAAGFARPIRGGRRHARSQKPQDAPAAVVAVKPPPAAPEAALEAPESAEGAFRDPLRTGDLPFDPDALAEEADFLRRRAKCLDLIANGVRGLQETPA